MATASSPLPSSPPSDLLARTLEGPGRRRTLESLYLVRTVRRFYWERLTARGRYVFWLFLAVGYLGLDTEQARAYMVFAGAAGPLLLAAVLALRRRPAVTVEADLPARLTAGRAVSVRVRVRVAAAGGGGPSAAGAGATARGSGALVAGWLRRAGAASRLRFAPAEAFVEAAPGRPAEVTLTVEATERGRHELPALGVGRTDPLGLFSTARVRAPGRVVLAYPRFYRIDALPLPAGRRYQPGGIPLASSLGDSTEFVGTREYREGDPLRRIHWRSWARRGAPVVKEYQEEYFARVALVLDTYLPRRPRPAERAAFEAAVSVLASVANHLGRTEDVVDVLAAGPELHEVSTGRSLGTLDNVLELLACLSPCHEPPFEVLGPRLGERLARLTTVVAVVLDWDERREAFLRDLHARGASIRVFVVREGETRLPVARSAALGEITVLPPAEVQRRLAEEGP